MPSYSHSNLENHDHKVLNLGELRKETGTLEFKTLSSMFNEFPKISKFKLVIFTFVYPKHFSSNCLLNVRSLTTLIHCICKVLVFVQI